MNFTGAEIPAWGMFALAVIWMAFQFVMKWQQAQAVKHGKAPTPEGALAEHDVALREIVTTLGTITAALGSISAVLAAMGSQVGEIANLTGELHQIHLGPKALDDDNRPKWWGDREELRRMREAIEAMNRRLASVERSLPGSARSHSTDSHRNLAALRPKKA